MRSTIIERERELIPLPSKSVQINLGNHGGMLRRLKDALVKYKYFYLMLIPGFVVIIMFSYIPMFGIIIAFKDYNVFQGIWGSKWIGFENFTTLFHSYTFYQVFSNTLLISLYKIILGFPVPIILAVLLNEVRSTVYKKTLQTIVYMPHFISWLVVAALLTTLLSRDDGFVNKIIEMFGGNPIIFMGDPKYFRSVLVLTDVWKESGWTAIIYLAALTGVPKELFEAATIDGANKIQKIWYISIAYIIPTITIMLLLRIGNIMNAGFEQIFAMYNPSVYNVSDILDTYVYRVGLLQTKYGFATAVGLFKSVIACTLVLFSNWFAKRFGQESLF